MANVNFIANLFLYLWKLPDVRSAVISLLKCETKARIAPVAITIAVRPERLDAMDDGASVKY